MKILRKNYFSAQLFEQFEGYDGTSKPDTKLVEIVDILKKAQIKHRQNDEFLIWSYWFLINNKPGKHVGYSSRLVELEIFFDYQKELWTRKDKIPDRLDDWIEAHCFEKVVSNTASHVLVDGGNNVFINPEKVRNIRSADKHDVDKLEALKKWHEISVKTFKDAKKVKIETVLDFIANPKWPETKKKNVNLPSEYEVDILQLPIPEIDEESIEKLAQNVDTSDYDSISGFGSQIQLQTKKALAQLAHYFTTQATKPNHTIALVENIIEEAHAIDTASLVHDDPSGFSKLLHLVRSPQLTKPEDMPTAIIVEKAQHLPDMAIQDDGAYSKDLAILQHGIKILDAYYTSLDLHHKALQKTRRGRKRKKRRIFYPLAVKSHDIKQNIHLKIK